MGNFKELLPAITTFAFDIDGVLTDGMVLPTTDGDLLRRMNIKDGFALQHAVKKGYRVVIISGGASKSVEIRLKRLGIDDIFLAAKDKVKILNSYMNEHGLKASEIIYMGDDIPDLEVMKLCGVKTCPKNAAIEIKQISDYISDKDGGQGCARDILEQVLRCNGDWFDLQ